MDHLGIGRCGVLVLVLWGVGCSTPAPAPQAPKAEAEPPKAPPRPRCSSSDERSPQDAKPVMKQVGEEVKGCFLLGKATSTPSSVGVELSIHEDGAVARAKASAGGAEKGQLDCVENAIKKLKFSKFCGDDVVIQWNYALSR